MTNPASSLALPLTCSWCGKRGDEDRRVVAGPDSNICEECVRHTCAVLGFQIVPPEMATDDGGK